MTSTSAPFTASSRALVPACAGVRALAAVDAMSMSTMQAIVVPSARSPAQGPPELH